MYNNSNLSPAEMALRRQVQSYYEHLAYNREDELPEWVKDVRRALITGEEHCLSGYLPWVWNVYEALIMEKQHYINNEQFPLT